MEDLINGQPEQDIDHCGNCIHDADSLDVCVLRKCKYAIAELIDCYEPKQLKQRWIPCSERLPSKADHTDDMVLVCYRNGSVRFNTYMNGWVQGNPVAWMPLPEPYREEEQDG